MPGNTVCINKKKDLTWYIGDSKMDQLLEFLYQYGIKVEENEMAKHINAVTDKIVVRIVEQENITKGGIVIPDTAVKEPQLTCVVVSRGRDVTGEITVGDTVLCHRSAGMDIMVDGEIYKVLADGEVFATVSECGEK